MPSWNGRHRTERSDAEESRLCCEVQSFLLINFTDTLSLLSYADSIACCEGITCPGCVDKLEVWVVLEAQCWNLDAFHLVVVFPDELGALTAEFDQNLELRVLLPDEVLCSVHEVRVASFFVI